MLPPEFKRKNVITLLCWALIFLRVQCFEKNNQEFILFTEPYPESQNCVPTTSTCLARSFSGNIRNLSELWAPVAKNAIKSWCSVTQGVWLFYSEPDFSPSSTYYGFVKTSRNSGRIGSSVMQCVNLQGTQRIQSIRHFAHANLLTPSISFFTRVSGMLQNQLFLDGDSISLSEPVTFGAYAFSGFRPWTIFSRPEFQGPSTCLNLPADYNPTTDARQVALLSVQINVNLQVGSARIGCSGENNQISPLATMTAVLNLGNSVTLFMERGTANQSETPSVIIDGPEFKRNSTNPGFTVGINSNNSSQVEQLYFSGKELVLPGGLNVTEFEPDNSKRPGNNSSGEWELCPELDFGGSCICLRANSSRVTFPAGVSLLSAKFGCSRSSPSSGGISNIVEHILFVLTSVILVSLL